MVELKSHSWLAGSLFRMEGRLTWRQVEAMVLRVLAARTLKTLEVVERVERSWEKLQQIMLARRAKRRNV